MPSVEKKLSWCLSFLLNTIITTQCHQNSNELPIWSPSILVLHVEFFDDALVNQDGNSNAEDADESEVTASPTEIVLEIFSSRAPFFNEFVLRCFHATPHFCFLLSLSSHLDSPLPQCSTLP